jgi:hypothetical protein
MNKQLKTPEKDLVLNIFADVGGHPSNWKGDLVFAMGKTVRALEYVDGRSLKNNLKNSRKKRADAGSNVFNSQKKRKATFKALNAHKKSRRAESRGEFFTDTELKTDFEKLTPNQRLPYEVLAESQLQQSSFLIDQVQEYLLKTNGRITWRRLATEIAG